MKNYCPGLKPWAGKWVGENWEVVPSWSWSCINNSCALVRHSCCSLSHALFQFRVQNRHVVHILRALYYTTLDYTALHYKLPCLAIKPAFYGTIQAAGAKVVIEYATTTTEKRTGSTLGIFNLGNNFRNAIKIILASCSSQIQIYLTTKRRFISSFAMFTCCSCMFAVCVGKGQGRGRGGRKAGKENRERKYQSCSGKSPSYCTLGSHFASQIRAKRYKFFFF